MSAMSFLKIRFKVSVLINEHLYHSLTDQNLDNFTVLELRDIYLSRSKRKNTPEKARIFVYSQIIRLVKLGMLEKNTEKNCFLRSC